MKIQRATWATALLCAAVFNSTTSRAFDAGSDGSYGPLNITTIGTNYIPMPADGIFRCTYITIATNCVVKFTPNSLNTPVYLLAQTNIQIDGIIDVSGGDGVTNDAVGGAAGPGGFPGGSAGFPTSIPAGCGQGPGGGTLKTGVNGFVQGGSYGTAAYGSTNTYGNLLLVPLIGGSGGRGAENVSSFQGTSGGGGGGAIVLASSTGIALNGIIRARGGKGIYQSSSAVNSGGGSGGAVRLVAPAITSIGSIDVTGGTNQMTSYFGGNGRVRIDCPAVSGTIKVVGNGLGTPNTPVLSYGRSMFVFPPTSPQLFFVNVAGTNVSNNAATNIVLGTGSSTTQTVTLCGTNFLGAVPVTIVATPLNGTPFATNLTMNFPAQNVMVSTNVSITVPAGIATSLKAYANYGVQP